MKTIFIKEAGKYVVDVVNQYVPGLENQGYQMVEVESVPANVASGYYYYEDGEFYLDEDKLFNDYYEARNNPKVVIPGKAFAKIIEAIGQSESSINEKLSDIQGGIAELFEQNLKGE